MLQQAGLNTPETNEKNRKSSNKQIKSEILELKNTIKEI